MIMMKNCIPAHILFVNRGNYTKIEQIVSLLENGDHFINNENRQFWRANSNRSSLLGLIVFYDKKHAFVNFFDISPCPLKAFILL